MIKNKRVDIIISTQAIGGAERASGFLYKNLETKLRHLRLLTLQSSANYEFESNFIQIPRKRRLAGLLPSRIDFLLDIRKVLKRNKTEVVITFMSGVTIMVFLSLIFMNVKIIACERTDPFNSSLSRRRLAILKFIYKLVSVVIVQTDRVKDRLHSEWELQNMTVIPNMVPIRSSAYLGINKCVTNIVTVSRLVDTKNNHLLIHSLRNILNVKCKLTIYGHGPEKKSLEALINKLDLKNYVKIISGETCINTMLVDADIFISLSELEGFSNALLEAVSCGVPSIAFDCDFGAREILNNGHCGILLESLELSLIEKNIKGLMDDYDQRLIFSQRGIKHAEKNFSIKSVMSSWLSVIDRV